MQGMEVVVHVGVVGLELRLCKSRKRILVRISLALNAFGESTESELQLSLVVQLATEMEE